MKNGELLRDFFVTKCCEAKKNLFFSIFWLPLRPGCITLPASRPHASRQLPRGPHGPTPAPPPCPPVDRHTIPER